MTELLEAAFKSDNRAAVKASIPHRMVMLEASPSSRSATRTSEV
jgi:hypothetical protein